MFFLPGSGLAHRCNVGRENIEITTSMLSKQTNWKALLVLSCPGRLVLRNNPCFPLWGHWLPLFCLCGLGHVFPLCFMGGSQGRDKQDAVQSPVPQPWSALTQDKQEATFSNRFARTKMLGSHSYL